MAGRKILDLTYSYPRLLIGLGLALLAQSAAHPQEPSPRPAEFTGNAHNLASVAADLNHSRDLPAMAIQPDVSMSDPLLPNPLWAIPLGSLTAARQRPIFSPSRRPPAGEMNYPLSAASEALGPPLVLLGAVAGETQSYAIFRDETTKDFVRLKIGESHSGWTLRQVNGREATFNKGRDTRVLQIETP